MTTREISKSLKTPFPQESPFLIKNINGVSPFQVNIDDNSRSTNYSEGLFNFHQGNILPFNKFPYQPMINLIPNYVNPNEYSNKNFHNDIERINNVNKTINNITNNIERKKKKKNSKRMEKDSFKKERYSQDAKLNTKSPMINENNSLQLNVENDFQDGRYQTKIMNNYPNHFGNYSATSCNFYNVNKPQYKSYQSPPEILTLENQTAMIYNSNRLLIKRNTINYTSKCNLLNKENLEIHLNNYPKHNESIENLDNQSSGKSSILTSMINSSGTNDKGSPFYTSSSKLKISRMVSEGCLQQVNHHKRKSTSFILDRVVNANHQNFIFSQTNNTQMAMPFYFQYRNSYPAPENLNTQPRIIRPFNNSIPVPSPQNLMFPLNCMENIDDNKTESNLSSLVQYSKNINKNLIYLQSLKQNNGNKNNQVSTQTRKINKKIIFNTKSNQRNLTKGNVNEKNQPNSLPTTLEKESTKNQDKNDSLILKVHIKLGENETKEIIVGKKDNVHNLVLDFCRKNYIADKIIPSITLTIEKAKLSVDQLFASTLDYKEIEKINQIGRLHKTHTNELNINEDLTASNSSILSCLTVIGDQEDNEESYVFDYLNITV